MAITLSIFDNVERLIWQWHMWQFSWVDFFYIKIVFIKFSSILKFLAYKKNVQFCCIYMYNNKYYGCYYLFVFHLFNEHILIWAFLVKISTSLYAKYYSNSKIDLESSFSSFWHGKYNTCMFLMVQ